MSKNNPRRIIVVQQSMQLPNRILISGRVVRRLLDAPAKAATLRSILFNIAVFFQRGVSNYPLSLKWGDTEISLSTNKMGYFSEEVPIETTPKQPIYLHHAGQPTRVHLYAVNQPNPTAIVSDVDDTILVSHSYLWYKNLFTSLLGRPATRLAFPHIAGVYQKFTKAGYHVFYVSSSKWYLFGFIKAFLKINEFPQGALFLKAHTARVVSFKSVYQRLTGKKNHLHKLQKIKEIIGWWPNLKLILVGDSGQMDAEIYYRLLVEHPDNVMAAYIRAVNHKASDKVGKLNRLLKQKNLPELKLISDAREIHMPKA